MGESLMAPDALLFLVSQPRAGSTLLQSMLAQHSDVATTPEPWIALHPVSALRPGAMHADFDSAFAHRALTRFLRDVGADASLYRERVGTFLLGLYAELATARGRTRVLDKTPRYYKILDDLVAMFPGAPIIVLLRNPLAVFHSVVRTWVGEDPSHLFLYRDDLLEAPGRLVHALAHHLETTHAVRYESLVTDPEGEIRGLCEAVGLPFEPGLLHYDAAQTRDGEIGDQHGVRGATAPVVGPVSAWKDGLQPAPWHGLAHRYLQELGPETVEAMGYSFKELAAVVRPDSVADGLWDEVMNGGPDRWQRECEKLWKERQQLEAAMAERRGEIDGLTRQVDELHRHIEAMRESWFRRLTRPVRKVLGERPAGKPDAS